MGFIDEARSILRETLSEFKKRTQDYVPRTLIKEGTTQSTHGVPPG